MRRFALVLPPLALAAGLALATPAQADPEYDTCAETVTSNMDFSACGAAMLDRREAALNRVWKEANQDLDPGAKKALLDEQRAWIAYKDKSCLALTTGYFGREGQVIHYYVCRADVIDARIDYLENLGNPGASEGDDAA